jgi:hypothetical protein
MDNHTSNTYQSLDGRLPLAHRRPLACSQAPLGATLQTLAALGLDGWYIEEPKTAGRVNTAMGCALISLAFAVIYSICNVIMTGLSFTGFLSFAVSLVVPGTVAYAGYNGFNTPQGQPRRGVKGVFDPPRGVAVTPLGQAVEPLTPLGSSMAARALLCRTCGQRVVTRNYPELSRYLFYLGFPRNCFGKFPKKQFPQGKKTMLNFP